LFDRFSRSVELVKASWRVLRSDKELLIFPAVSFVLTAIVTLGFFVPFYATGALADAADGRIDVVGVVLAFLYYLVTYTVIIYSNVALVAAAMVRLEGGDPTLRDGFRAANQRLPAIIGYAAISATVGMILRAIAERGGIAGQIVAGLVGVAWNLATFLAVPVLVMEGVGPIEAIKRSGSLLRRTWGEQVVGNVGLSLVFGLIAVGIVLLGVGLTFALGALGPVGVATGIALTVIALAAVGLIGSALSGIFTASLYRFVTRGDGGAMFPAATLQAAFRPKG
jgi:hypothetical protein